MSADSTSSSTCEVQRSRRDRSRGDVDLVRSHYNEVSEKTTFRDFKTSMINRSQSHIFQLRVFNNWIKSCFIQEFMERAKHQLSRRESLRALDICCGKGGDLQKWRNAGIRKLVCVDLSESSVSQCEQRYQQMRTGLRRKLPSNSHRNYDHVDNSLFEAEFHVADCSRSRLSDIYCDPRTRFDFVSCQFALHYSFETVSQADLMMRNCAESLRRGGIFICTIPNANEIVRRCRLGLSSSSTSSESQSNERKGQQTSTGDCEKSHSQSSVKSNGKSSVAEWSNEIARISFQHADWLQQNKLPPLFGTRYSFYLQDAVDCPEYLVYLPLLEKLASRHGLRMVLYERFDVYFERKIRDRECLQVLDRMGALQPFSLLDQSMRRNLRFDEGTNYSHAVAHLRRTNDHAVRTMSKSEWEVATLYMVVAFEKITDEYGSTERRRSQPEVRRSSQHTHACSSKKTKFS